MQPETANRIVELCERMKAAIVAGKGEDANKVADELIGLAATLKAPVASRGPKVVSRGPNVVTRGPKPI